MAKKSQETKKEGPRYTSAAFYIEAADMETGEPIVLEAPPKIPYVIRDLKKTLNTFGDSFGSQVIAICGYAPQPHPDKKGEIVMQRIEIARGRPIEVIKNLEAMCMDKGELANHVLHVLGTMARNSGLKAVSITYLVEEEDGDILTGGNTMLFVDKTEIPDGELTQLYNSMKTHAEQFYEQMTEEGRRIEDQDGPKLLKPGDAGFIMPAHKR